MSLDAHGLRRPPGGSVLIDIVIPARDARDFLGATLQSLLAQSFERWRAWVVDDGSVDGTAQCVGDAGDARVNLLRTPGIGAPGARNTGLGRAAAPYVMFLDADDCLRPDALERLLPPLEADPSTVLAYGREDLISPAGERVDRPFARPRRRCPSGEVLERILAECFIPTTGAALLRTDVVRQLGGFRIGLPASQDWELWCRMALRGTFSFVGQEPVIDYRIHPQAMSRSVAPERYLEANDAVFENSDIRARLGSRGLLRLRRKREARNHYNAAKEAVRQANWVQARRWALGSLLRDAHNPRAMLILVCALAGRAPAWMMHRLGAS